MKWTHNISFIFAQLVLSAEFFVVVELLSFKEGIFWHHSTKSQGGSLELQHINACTGVKVNELRDLVWKKISEEIPLYVSKLVMDVFRSDIRVHWS